MYHHKRGVENRIIKSASPTKRAVLYHQRDKVKY